MSRSSFFFGWQNKTDICTHVQCKHRPIGRVDLVARSASSKWGSTLARTFSAMRVGCNKRLEMVGGLNATQSLSCSMMQEIFKSSHQCWMRPTNHHQLESLKDRSKQQKQSKQKYLGTMKSHFLAIVSNFSHAVGFFLGNFFGWEKSLLLGIWVKTCFDLIGAAVAAKVA